MAVYVFRYIWHYLLVQGGLIMKLKKRIYLLTPLLVLVCVIAAGVFMKAPAKVEAETYLINKGSYEAVKLAEVIDNEESEYYDETLGDKYQIKEFDTILFDYDGFEYNSVFAYNMGEFFAFKEGNVTSSSQYKKPDGNTRTITNYNTDINAGGYPAKHGIVNSKLSNGNLVFYNGISGLWAGGQVGRLLFDESIDQLSDIFSQNLCFFMLYTKRLVTFIHPQKTKTDFWGCILLIYNTSFKTFAKVFPIGLVVPDLYVKLYCSYFKSL